MSVTSSDKKIVKKFWLIVLLKLEKYFSVVISVQCCKALILLDGYANSYRGRGRFNPPFCCCVCVLYNSDLFDPRSGKWLLPMDKDFLWGHG